MPATAGRVRMPHNNRVQSSAALQMTGIWKNTIGYDPYAAEDEDKKVSETSYEQAQGLMALAKLSNKSNDVRGACKKCGMVGHLTFQCRNHLGNDDQRKVASDSSRPQSDDHEPPRTPPRVVAREQIAQRKSAPRALVAPQSIAKSQCESALQSTSRGVASWSQSRSPSPRRKSQCEPQPRAREQTHARCVAVALAVAQVQEEGVQEEARAPQEREEEPSPSPPQQQ